MDVLTLTDANIKKHTTPTNIRAHAYTQRCHLREQSVHSLFQKQNTRALAHNNKLLFLCDTCAQTHMHSGATAGPLASLYG